MTSEKHKAKAKVITDKLFEILQQCDDGGINWYESTYDGSIKITMTVEVKKPIEEVSNEQQNH